MAFGIVLLNGPLLALGLEVGADVMVSGVGRCLLWQPKNGYGVSHVEVAAVLLELRCVVVEDGSGSSQPNQPGVLHVDEGDAEWDLESCEVGVAFAVVVGGTVVVVTVIFFSSLQPNQPGSRQLVVV